MGKAKTASKNNPHARSESKKIFHNGKEIEPFKFVGQGKAYIAAQYAEGKVPVKGPNGDPMPWSAASS